MKTKDSVLATILIFCTSQKCYLYKSLFVCIFQSSKWSDANVTCISEVLLKIILTFFNGPCVYFVWPLEYLTKTTPVPTKWAKIILVKVKSCNKLLITLLIYISISLTSVMGCIFFNFGCLSSSHSIFMWERMWGSVVTFRNQRDLRAKKFGKQCSSIRNTEFLFLLRLRKLIIFVIDLSYRSWYTGVFIKHHMGFKSSKLNSIVDNSEIPEWLIRGSLSSYFDA